MISTKSRVAPPDAATSCRARTLSRRWKGCAKAEIRRGSRRAARATDGSGWPAERPTAHHRIRRAALRGRRRRSSAEPHSSLGRPQPGQNRNALVSVLPQRRQGRRFTDSLYAPPAHVPPSAPQRVTTRRGAALGRGGPFLSTPCRTRRDRGLSAEAPAACRLPPAGRTRPDDLQSGLHRRGVLGRTQRVVAFPPEGHFQREKAARTSPRTSRTWRQGSRETGGMAIAAQRAGEAVLAAGLRVRWAAIGSASVEAVAPDGGV